MIRLKVFLKFNFFYFFLLLIFFSIIFFSTTVSKSLSKEDIDQIQKLNLDKDCLDLLSFEMELKCIKETQKRIKQTVDVKLDNSEFNCIYDSYDNKSKFLSPDYEPKLFIEKRFGCCVVRSRFLEKTLMYYSFPVRHLAIYRTKKFLDLFSENNTTISHSTTEVMTSRGWMYVDSVDGYVGLTKQYQPVTAKTYLKIDKSNLLYKFAPKFNKSLYEAYTSDGFEEWNKNNNIWNKINYKIYIIYGLHSRHGNYFDPKFNLNVPDINWSDFMYNFM